VKGIKMAIGFGRVEFTKRSGNRNTCQLSAYLSRSRIFFEGNCVLEPKLYDFTHRESVPYHEIILPDGADESLKNPEALWNLIEKKEVRKDAQVSMHLILALPDDKEIMLKDRIDLTKSFIKKYYNGLVAEYVIHPPERRIEFTEKNEDLDIAKGSIGNIVEEKNGKYIISFPTKGSKNNAFIEIKTDHPGISVQEHNWHTHVQLTTRRLKSGRDFETYKAKDLMPVIKKGRVVGGFDVGKLWAQHQNEFFLFKGLSLKVDENGIIPQEHLGPIRMRGRAFALLEEHERRLNLNGELAKNPENILKALTKRQSLFTRDDVERFILKHTPADSASEVLKNFWKQEDLIQLRDTKTQKFVLQFTSKNVLKEERQILRLADRIYKKPQKPVPEFIHRRFIAKLSKEQEIAYKNILNGKGLCCIQGYAGTGKSYLLKALKNTYEERGLTVRSFGPDNATANVLKSKGLTNSENLYYFLYSHKYGLRNLHKGFEVWILDEAGKVGNEPFLEFLKLAEAAKVKVILAGDNKQFPPVERGEAFTFFCERYQTEVLEEIQRQKDELFRSIAKDLAMGKTGEALDKLSSNGAIKWSSTKKESIENLVLKWAEDHRDRGTSGSKNALENSIIVAHTNAEVRVLNEMVRLVRQKRGEISSREFKCEVISGSQDKAIIYISEGDRIEFRKKDVDLGINNGDVGVLMRTNKDQFSVALQEYGKKTRLVDFNPSQYRGFQLGYASTAQRSQGRTIHRAYILHSPHLNRQMAYVKLTRHIDDVFYFVSKDEASSISDLKRQALRDGSKRATYNYTDTEEIEKVLSIQKKENEIEILRSAKEFSLRVKGFAIQTWEQLKGQTLNFIEKKQDRTSGKEFFSFKSDSATVSMGNVHEVSEDEKFSSQEVVEKIIQQDRSIEMNETKRTALFVEEHLGDSIIRSSDTAIHSPSWRALPKEEKGYFDNYFDASLKASELREIVRVECNEKLDKISQSASYRDWQKACAIRNEFAYCLRPLLIKKECRGILKEGALYYIEAHAKRHENLLKNQEQRPFQREKTKELDVQLTSHIEPLLYKLFPDGPSAKTAKGYRFGSKGSLSVTHSRPKAGQFYDFERQEGGSLLQLISRELKLDKREARIWAGEFLKISNEIMPSASFKKLTATQGKESDWVSVKPPSDIFAPTLKEHGKMHYYFRELVRHPYRDENGDLLYYVLRLQDKSNSLRKITPPLSYGYFKDNPKKLSWECRGYKDENGKKPLYNLHLLKESPLSPVMIVEGEKTADKALEKFCDKNCICMTWPGGASSVSKADWSSLFEKDIMIWPDNDEAGFKAAGQVCDELKKIGAKEICIFDSKELFEKLPPKWDLADPLPSGVEAFSFDFHLKGEDKNYFQQSVLRELDLEKKLSLVEKLRAIDLLYAYEKNNKKRFEEDLSKNLSPADKNSIHLRHTYEGVMFLQKEKAIYKMVITDPEINASGEIAKRLTYQMHLYEAEHGKPPSQRDVSLMKTTIQNLAKSSTSFKWDEFSHDIKDLAFDRSFKAIYEKVQNGHKVKNAKAFDHVQCEMLQISRQKSMENIQNQALTKHKIIERDRSHDL